jgi:hypothetical protein
MIRSLRHHDLILLASICLTLMARASLAGGVPAQPSSQPSGPAASQPAADAKVVKVLYVEGYPRWEYRYIKLALLHQPAVRISCLLTSADPGYEQEASDPDPKIGFLGRVKAFPATADALAAYDVILLGDVDRRLFTDKQLELIADFVRKRGGGLGMIAGPRFAPVGYRGTPIERLLPVNIDRVAPDGKDEQFSAGFRPVLTEAGRASAIFKILQDPPGAADGHPELPEGLLYWYCRGVSVRAAADEKPPQVLAVHPSAKAPDGSDAPVLVLGRFGKGRVLFSAIDDSWRWRAAGGQSAYVSYWVEQLRTLAPTKGLGH